MRNRYFKGLGVFFILLMLCSCSCTKKNLSDKKLEISKEKPLNTYLETRLEGGTLENTVIVITGIETDEEKAKQIIAQLREIGEIGEAQKVLLIQNPTHSKIGDLLESAIDKFGSDDVYSQVAIFTGKILWQYRDQTSRIIAFDQGTLLVKKAFEYILNTHGEEAIPQLKYKEIDLKDTWINVTQFKKMVKSYGFKGKIKGEGKKLTFLQNMGNLTNNMLRLMDFEKPENLYEVSDEEDSNQEE